MIVRLVTLSVILQVGIAFEKLEEGFENAMKDYNKKQITQLNTLINHLLGDLTALDRLQYKINLFLMLEMFKF